MKQVIQNIRNGELAVRDLPAPSVQPGHVLIANQASLVSAGTEKMIMDLAKKSLLGKARERPDHVRRVLEKIRNEGLTNTLHQVRTKLDEPMTMGYSSSGIVVACGDGVQNLKPGDRVASNGPHAEFVSVPKHLCAKASAETSFEQACFGVLGSIALQGVRLSKCQLGETVLVVGLGLIGQLTVAIAKAAGFKVIGTDLEEAKCQLAIKMGADAASPSLDASTVQDLTHGLGVDAVLITASTKSDQPIQLASEAVRKKGRIVLVGVVGLELDRRAFFFKEAEFVVSCSYGPGRYEPDYEERGFDYPAHWVRWTEQRNIQSVIDMIAGGQLDVSQLISHRFQIEDAGQAYELIESQEEPFLGIVLRYPEWKAESVEHVMVRQPSRAPTKNIRYGMLGVGNFAKMVMLPAIQKCSEFEPVTICSAKGLTASHVAESGEFETVCTDEVAVFDDDSIQCVFSITRHDLHAAHVIRAIENGKDVFVEKPLCIQQEDLARIEQALYAQQGHRSRLMVGFNRRFSPASEMLRKHFESTSKPLTVSIRFNAGEIPSDHWTQSDLEGGGRIIGEACHAIDLATYLTGSIPIRVYAESVQLDRGDQVGDDQCAITLRHANGSISTIGYFAGGDRAFSKERVEVFGGGMVGVIDDFKVVTLVKNGKTSTSKRTMDKGHQAEIRAWCDALLTGDASPIPWPEIKAVTTASIAAVRSLREGLPIDLS